MNGRRSRRWTAERGTTLIELLVVLAILGLLAGIAAPQMMRYFEHGRSSAAETQIATLSASLHLFHADVGRYPTTAEGLAALTQAPPEVENWSGPYLRNASAIKDPWGRSFVYRAPGRQSAFDLYSLGPQAAEGRKVAPHP